MRYAYNDGQKIYYSDGSTEPAPRYIYQKKTRLDLGLEVAPATAERRAAMLHAASQMSFETQADCARLLAWSVLAPFCGSLPVRPAVFLTGRSGSGKSTVIQYVARRLSLAAYRASVTEAGIRQEEGYDCLPYIIEEMESDSEAQRANISNVFALMRQSFSEDSPRIVKGSMSGKAISYVARIMFLYAAIRPGFEREADANRIAVVDLKKPENDWSAVKAGLVAAFTLEACASVRAFAWAHLAEIIEGAGIFADAIQEVAPSFDTRRALAEGILWSAHWRVWCDRFPAAEEMKTWLAKVYEQKPVEAPGDDAEILLNRLFDEVVQVFDAPSKRYTLEFMLRALSTGHEAPLDDGELVPQPLSPENRERYRKTCSQYGMYVNREGQVCLALARPQIARILQTGPQYSRVLARHPLCVAKEKSVTPPGEVTRRCLVFSSAVLDGEAPF